MKKIKVVARKVEGKEAKEFINFLETMAKGSEMTATCTCPSENDTNVAEALDEVLVTLEDIKVSIAFAFSFFIIVSLVLLFK